jgi:hypothetical protein
VADQLTGTPRATGASGLTGAVLVIAALAVTPRYCAVAAVLLLLGALPLAASTWWGVATPLVVALCLLLGRPLRGRATGADTLPR